MRFLKVHSTPTLRKQRFLYVQSIVDDWWQKWYNLVLPSLVPCYKWQQRHRNVKLGDVCLIRYKKSIRSTYRLGRVSDVKTGKDGLVRSVRLKYKLPPEKVFRYVDRAIHGIVVIVPFEEQWEIIVVIQVVECLGYWCSHDGLFLLEMWQLVPCTIARSYRHAPMRLPFWDMDAYSEIVGYSVDQLQCVVSWCQHVSVELA